MEKGSGHGRTTFRVGSRLLLLVLCFKSPVGVVYRLPWAQPTLPGLILIIRQRNLFIHCEQGIVKQRIRMLKHFGKQEIVLALEDL